MGSLPAVVPPHPCPLYLLPLDYSAYHIVLLVPAYTSASHHKARCGTPWPSWGSQADVPWGGRAIWYREYGSDLYVRTVAFLPAGCDLGHHLAASSLPFFLHEMRVPAVPVSTGPCEESARCSL